MKGPIVCDIEGLELTADDRRRLAHPPVGMVILFTRNYADPEQLTQLCRSIHALDPRLLIAVDHEGGRVQRFRAQFTQIPAMAEYGRQYAADAEQAARSVTAAGYVMAAELRACGVDFTFAPVLDLNWEHSEIIGHRAFALDPRVVTRLARALSQGLALAGMSNCGKHFPGHGWASADSHLTLPVDERSAQRILTGDAKPYAWMGVGLSSVMTAHVCYPEIDAQPASFSRVLVTDILRGQLGFEGLVFSDDLSMNGAKGQGDVTARAHKALAAGCDALIVCNAPQDTDTLLETLQWSPSEAFNQRSQRIAPKAVAPDWATLHASSLYHRALQQMQPACD